MLELHFDEERDLSELLYENRDELSQVIVKTVLNNLESKEGGFLIALITFGDSDTEAEVVVSPEDFLDTLNQNLTYFEEEEDYDTCIKIREAVKYLTK